MARIEIGKYLTAGARVCGGRLVFRGTRIMVADVVSMSARGYSPEKIAAEYNGIISPAAVREALDFINGGLIKEVGTAIEQAA